MTLIYNLKKLKVEAHMSDSNMGGRTNKSCTYHIWILNGIIHDQLSSIRKTPVVIQQYDFCQMFDGMENSEACGDIFNYGVNDDHLKLIHEANREVVINVKTPHGISGDYTLTQRIMQGDTWAPSMASAQVDSFGKEMLEEKPKFMYKYMEEVSIPLLGMVDDLIGITNAGYKTNQLNAFVNVKAADKDLQFGIEKCKSMIVSKKNPYTFQIPALSVDSWEIKHEENGDIKETYTGKQNMKLEDSLMYLGHVVSKKGGNIQNILHKRNKAIGTERLIMKLIQNMGPYTFEGALIYIQTLIRNSILYASETMYNVIEKEWRALEKIEESVLIKVFKTKRSCPRHLLYLETGMYPARYQVHRQMLNFLQYILQQPSESLLQSMLEVQTRNPTKGDWVSTVTELLEKYNLKMSMKEIQSTTPSIFKNLVKKNVEKCAFNDLIKKQKSGQKGQLLVFERLEMSDYLLPECKISVEDKIELFSIRSEMNNLPCNFGKETQCEQGCYEVLNSEHIYSCTKLNKQKIPINNYENILKGTMNQKVEVLKKIQENNLIRMQKLRDSVDINVNC